MSTGFGLSRMLRAMSRRLLRGRSRPSESSLVRMLQIGMRHCTRPVEVIFDVGANRGEDAERMRRHFNVAPGNVYVFEPHPELADDIRRTHPDFHLVRCALSDAAGRATFNMTPAAASNSGVSTLGERVLVRGSEDYSPIEVAVDTLDHAMESFPDVDVIDLMKIDVEGFTYEVLQGGRATLAERVAVLQVESEVVEVFRGQKLYPEVAATLSGLGFIETYKEQNVTQNDTVWVHERFWKRASDFYRQNTSS